MGKELIINFYQRDMNKIYKLAEHKSMCARLNAFALKSERKIGAAVVTTGGEVYEGCNIEANISGLGTCAERLAINHAIVHGEYKYQALVTYSDKEPIIPCGACLQYLVEFLPLVERDIKVICFGKDETKTFMLKSLLPFAYISKKAVEKVRNYFK